MWNLITSNIGIQNSIKLFITHWKYWKNYEDSTVLIGTSNIDSVQADLPFNWGYIIKNWKPLIQQKLIKYEPYDYEMAVKENANLINQIKQEKAEMKKNIAEYNQNYFKSLDFEFKSLS